jgi:hypothetical protein
MLWALLCDTDSTRQVAEVVQDKARSPAVVYVVRTSRNAYNVFEMLMFWYKDS